MFWRKVGLHTGWGTMYPLPLVCNRVNHHTSLRNHLLGLFKYFPKSPLREFYISKYENHRNYI